MFVLGEKSRDEMRGVHPDLVRVFERGIEITSIDYGIHDGIRTPEEQARYVQTGVSTTLDSKHLPQAEGFGHAIDAVPYVNGKLRWEWGPIYHVASAIHQAANELDVKLRWGGVWDRVFNDLNGTPEGLRRAVDAYVARRKAIKRRAFIDGPHFELVRST